MLELPPLFKTNASGNIIEVQIYTDGKQIYRKTISPTSKKITKIKVPEGGMERAKKMAETEWKKKKRSGYQEEGATIYDVKPMLAKKFDERYVEWPAGVSPKLDGVRCMAHFNEDVILLSRTGKEFFFKDLIRDHLYNIYKNCSIKNLVLDGELYVHNLGFSEIMRLVSPKINPPQDEDTLNYYVFDILSPPMMDHSYINRMDVLEKMEATYQDIYKPKERVIKFVFYDDVKNIKDVDRLHDTYVKKGYEGAMIRNLGSKYRSGFRSSDLLKYKKFEDDEFQIVDFREGTKNDRGAIIFIVKNNGDDRTFAVKPKLGVEERRRMFRVGDKYLYKWYTVRYQPDSSDNLPRFPVGIAIRDYE